jgi:hypothetical protein
LSGLTPRLRSVTITSAASGEGEDYKMENSVYRYLCGMHTLVAAVQVEQRRDYISFTMRVGRFYGFSRFGRVGGGQIGGQMSWVEAE